jgi:hypothetical protein
LWSGSRLVFAHRREPLYLVKRTYIRLRRKPLQLELVAPDDLADPRAIQADKLANVPERKPFFLSLGEGFAPSLTRRLAVALKLLLSHLHSFAGGFALGVVGHRRRLFELGPNPSCN